MENNAQNPEILFRDGYIAVCRKPAGMLATDEPGGLPEFVKKASNKKEIFVVHRLDREVSGLIVYALTPKAASILSSQITDGSFEKQYYAVVHGEPEQPDGRLEDLLYHDPRTNKTFIVDRERKGVRKAELEYKTLETKDGLSLLQIHLISGRTHQIRVQFGSRKLPLCGDRRYGSGKEDCDIALLSEVLRFVHPKTGEKLEFSVKPLNQSPWNLFSVLKNDDENN